jgi:hypothetical protein
MYSLNNTCSAGHPFYTVHSLCLLKGVRFGENNARAEHVLYTLSELLRRCFVLPGSYSSQDTSIHVSVHSTNVKYMTITCRNVIYSTVYCKKLLVSFSSRQDKLTRLLEHGRNCNNKKYIRFCMNSACFLKVSSFPTGVCGLSWCSWWEPWSLHRSIIRFHPRNFSFSNLVCL